MEEEKIIHSEVLEGKCETQIRIASKVEGEDKARIFDLEGHGVMGVMISQDGPMANGQAFVVGANVTSLLQGMEVIINMVNSQLAANNSLQSQLARMALATLLVSKADKIVEEVIARDEA